MARARRRNSRSRGPQNTSSPIGVSSYLWEGYTSLVSISMSFCRYKEKPQQRKDVKELTSDDDEDGTQLFV